MCNACIPNTVHRGTARLCRKLQTHAAGQHKPCSAPTYKPTIVPLSRDLATRASLLLRRLSSRLEPTGIGAKRTPHIFQGRVKVHPVGVRFTGVLEKLDNEEAISGHPLNRLDEVSSQVQPVAGFLVLARSYEGLERRVLLARREASCGRTPRKVFSNGNIRLCHCRTI